MSRQQGVSCRWWGVTVRLMAEVVGCLGEVAAVESLLKEVTEGAAPVEVGLP